MELDDALIWLIELSCLSLIFTLLRHPVRDQRGWLWVAIGVAVVTSASHLLLRERAGWIGGGLYIGLILVPLIGARRLRTLALAQRYAEARPLARLLGWMHPWDGWPLQTDFLAALGQAQKGEWTEAFAGLDRLAERPGVLRRAAQIARFRLSGDWVGLLRWAEVEYRGLDDRIGLGELGHVLRALGETAQSERMVRVFCRQQGLFPAASWRGMKYQLLAPLFAFTGERGALAELFAGPLSDLPPELRSFYSATAAATRGVVFEAQSTLRNLEKTSDAVLRRAVAQRLAQPLPPIGPLTPEATALIERIHRDFSEEEQYNLRIRGQPLVTISLGLIILAVFGLEVAAGGATDPEVLASLGGLILGGPRVETWRLLAWNFLHLGSAHLLMNLLGLGVIGPFVERTAGPRDYLGIYLVAGFGAGLVLLAMATPGRTGLAVGASGSIMGLLGATAAIYLRAYWEDRGRVAKERLRAIGGILFLQSIFDLSVRQVSMAGHLAGLTIGFLVTLLLGVRVPHSRRPHDRPRAGPG